MSIETLLAANIKATEALTEVLTQLVPALAAGKKTAAKDKTTTATTAADPAATSAAPAGAAAGSAAGATTATPGAVLAADHPLAKAVTAFAKAHGRDTAIAAVNKFGGEGRASNIKPIDQDKAREYVLSEHARLDAAKAAAAVKPVEESLI